MSSRYSYTVLDDTTLQEFARLRDESMITRLYDFDAEVVTSVVRSEVTGSYGNEGNGTSAHHLVMQFNEVGARKLQKAHEKLVELGGDPPSLDEAVSKPRKQPLKIGS